MMETTKTLLKLPPKLQRHLSELKTYVDRHADGVSLPQVKRKVSSLQTLNKKELEILVNFVRTRENIHVYTVYRTGAPGQESVYFRHARHGDPIAPFAHQLTSPVKPEANKASFIREWGAPLEPVETVIKKECYQDMPKAKEEVVAPMNAVNLKVSASELRRQAAEMMRQADLAEQQSQENDLFNKRLGPIKTDLLRATHNIRTSMDSLIDAMSDLEKGMDRLKALTA